MFKYISACLIAVCFFVIAADAHANIRQPKKLNCNTQFIECGADCIAYHQCLSGPGANNPNVCANELQALCDCQTAIDPGFNCNNIPNVPFVPKNALEVDGVQKYNSGDGSELYMHTLE